MRMVDENFDAVSDIMDDNRREWREEKKNSRKRKRKKKPTHLPHLDISLQANPLEES